MRILLIGDDPNNIGGVVNYTKPLAEKFVELGHDVHYLCTGSINKHYNFLFFPYIKNHKGCFPFNLYEIVNCPNRAMNFRNPELDVENKKVEHLFLKLIKKVRPDIIHINEMMGLPVSVIKVAKENGIKVVRTFHVYWHLCQKRVMIDFEGKLCKGPCDVTKCSRCVSLMSVDKLYMNRLRRVLNFNKLEKLLKSVLHKNKPHKALHDAENINAVIPCNDRIAEQLKRRLESNIEALSDYVDINICVSNDVKAKMMEYGVPENKLYVNHIGSLISEKVSKSTRNINLNRIVIGNIGGVGYYKGNHILIDAFNMMKNKHLCSLNIYGWYNNEYKNKIMKDKDDSNISFLGKYTFNDLPSILHEIDVMVLPSICNDTAPQTIFEAYSAGIPIVASNIGGFPDFIINGKNGMLFEPGNVTQLSNVLDNIVENPGVIDIMRKNITTPKTITENAGELVDIYCELCGKPIF